jgi:hypothetical protein
MRSRVGMARKRAGCQINECPGQGELVRVFLEEEHYLERGLDRVDSLLVPPSSTSRPRQGVRVPGDTYWLGAGDRVPNFPPGAIFSRPT